jgi:hypothetical protein
METIHCADGLKTATAADGYAKDIGQDPRNLSLHPREATE